MESSKWQEIRVIMKNLRKRLMSCIEIEEKYKSVEENNKNYIVKH